MWRHLFIDGEFPERERLLSGLTLAEVTARPGGAPHSIYEELWHAATWQRIVVERDEALEVWFDDGHTFPAETPTSEAQWQELVAGFLEGAEKALELGGTPERIAAEIDDGVTLADALHSLAVHNAYHLGKIVSLRQAIGSWPPR